MASAVTAAKPSGSAGGPEPPRWQVRLWRALQHNARPALLVAALVAVVLGAVGAVAGSTGRTVYTSTTTMLIDDPYALATAGDQGEMLKLNSLLIKYAGLITTDVIAGPVAQQLGLPMDEVLGSVSAQVNGSTETLLLPVTATWSTPAEAQRLSQVVANQLTNFVKLQDVQYHIPAADRFTLTTVNPATAPVAVGPSKTKAAALSMALAGGGFLLAFVLTQLVRNRDELTA